MSLMFYRARLYMIWFVFGALMFLLISGCGSSDNKLTVLDPRGQPSGVFGRRGAPDAHMMAIFDPETQPTISRDELVLLRMAPRLDTLEGKNIYLVDTGFEGGKEFFDEMHLWFKENMPLVNTVVAPKPGNPFADSPEFWIELSQKADGIVFGVGG